MKKINFNILFLLFLTTTLLAQNIPQGMSYQAVARDADGQLLTETPINIRIALISNIERGIVAYSEIHNIKTNKYGLFNFTIGQGESLKGSFEEIPWESEEIWLEVAMDAKAGEDFKEMNTTKLLTVPYAFRAGSANELIPINPNGDSRVPWWGQPWWNIEGLEKTDPDKHFVGNIDSVDLVFRTNNIERFRIKANGQLCLAGSLDIAGNLYVHGDSVIFDHDLFVGDNIYVENNVTAGGDGTFFNIHALNNGTIDNILTVNGPTQLNSTLDVLSNKTNLSYLEVHGPTHLNGILDETMSGIYVGGSLDLGYAWLNTNGRAYWGKNEGRSLTKKEHLLVCQIYLKYKTPGHEFYKKCEEYVTKAAK